MRQFRRGPKSRAIARRARSAAKLTFADGAHTDPYADGAESGRRDGLYRRLAPPRTWYRTVYLIYQVYIYCIIMS